MDLEVIKLFENLERNNVPVTEFYTELKSRNSSLEKIKYIKKFYEWTSPVEDFTESRKNGSLSVEFREKGNRGYVNKDLQEALVNYNLAIQYAPPNSKELGLGFANRSAVFQDQREFQHAIDDIQKALENYYPENLIEKLTKRKRICMEELGTTETTDAERESLSENSVDVSSEEGRRRIYCHEVLFRIKNPHKRIMGAADFVEIRENQEYGRFVVVTKNVSPGTVLMVEDPFVVTLKDELENWKAFCAECFKSLPRSWLPCNGCVFAFYCDANCRAKSQVGHHKYECSLLPFLRRHPFPQNVSMALRIICKVGPTDLFGIYTSSDPKWETNPTQRNKHLIPGFDPEQETYNSHDYQTVFHLTSNNASTNPEQDQNPNFTTGEHAGFQMVLAATEALILTHALNHYSNFFEWNCSSDFTEFVASLLLQHIYTVGYNSMSLHEIPLERNENRLLNQLREDLLAERMKSLQFTQIGTGLYPLTSLLNHSCDPNIARINTRRNGTMAVVALKPLRAGDQIFNCYGKFFGTCPLKERKDFLELNYNFKCACPPCLLDWPMLFELRSQKPTFMCSHCTENPLFLMPDKTFQRCGKCKRKFQTMQLIDQVKKFLDIFKAAYQLTLKNRAVDAVEALCGFLESVNRSVAPPFLQSFVAQETLKQSLGIIASTSLT